MLPVKKLVDQYHNPVLAPGLDNTLVLSFTLMYIQLGLPNLSPADQAALLPDIVKDIAKASPKNASTIFGILLKILAQWSPPERGSTAADQLRSELGFDKRPEDAAFLAEAFTNLFLLDLTPLLNQSAAATTTDKPLSCRSPGLGFEQYEFLTRNHAGTFSGNNALHEAKRNALKLLLAGSAFTEEELYFPLLVASLDKNSAINSQAETPFKKLKVNLEDEARVRYLYRLVLGDLKNGVLPATEVIKARAVQILGKSVLAANIDPLAIVNAAITSDYSKCVQAGFAFIRWVSKHASQEIIAAISNQLVDAMMDWITKTGWPQLPVADNNKLGPVRSLAYEAIGSIISRNPTMITDLKKFRFLLEALEKDTASMKPSIQESLSEILPAVEYLPDNVRVELRELLFRYLLDPHSDDSCKYVAVKFAVRAYPFSDAAARVICLLAMARTNRSDVLEEAKRGLHPHWFKTVNTQAINHSDDSKFKIEFPRFGDLIQLVDATSSRLGGAVPTPHIRGFSLSVFDAIVSFLQQVLVMEAVENKMTALVVDEDWATKIETAIDLDNSVRDILVQHIASTDSASIIEFLNLAFDALRAKNSEVETASASWLRILSLSPPLIVESQIRFLKDITELLSASREKTRNIASTALGIIATHDAVNANDINQLTGTLSTLIEGNYSTFKSVDSLHGAVLGLGAILSRLHFRGRSSVIDYTNVLDSFLKIIQDIFNTSKNLQLIDSCLGAISQLSTFGALISQPESLFSELIATFEMLALKRENEKAVLALGLLSLCDPAFTTSTGTAYLDKVFALTSSKHSEYMFSSGEALSVVAAGWNSKVLKRSLDIQGVSVANLPRHEANIVAGSTADAFLANVLDRILVSAKSTKPGLRKFSCIWLLSLLQYTGHLPATQAKLEHIHVAFMRFLPEQDELIQESASRGLSMVYEMGDSVIKEALVRNLVSSFTSENRHGVNAGTVSEETQLFEPGVLNTGDGSVSTYKDILNLASELGDPGLIYKFMALAGHSALWSSRKGAAFGLGSIVSKANLDEMMENNQRLSKSLIPKLYRYKFDSNPSVQQAMQGIWDSLVKDKSAAINDNFDDILEELLKGMGDKEWRVRQASTAALSDLLQGRPIELYQDKLERIWMMSFRAVDDIKESVRNAGLQLTRGLATTLIRHVDTSTGTSPARATALLEHLVPFLMGNFGLQSEAQEVQSFALETIINLCKKGGAALKPFIPGLVEELLVLMSTLEPQAMNYLALNADKYGLTHNAIDASRLASVRGSPIMEAVEQMVDQATDDKTMGLLVPRLAAAIKKSVGLPSKVGASRVLVALTIRHLQGAGPYADTLLTSAAGQLGDRNDTISQSYATATGYLCRIASDKAVLKYIARLKTLYFGTDEASRPRLIAGFAVNALSKHAPETFSRLASTILPFVYVAKHDADKAVQKVFDTVWSDNTGGSGAVRLYLPEIMALAGEQLAEQRQWGIRQVAAQSVADASNLIGDERLPREEFSRLLNILFDACVGRSWSGKELVLMALVRLVERAPDDLLADGSLLARANKVVLTEARRKNKTYQIKALASLAEYLVAFPQAELYEAMFDLAEPYLEPPSESDSDVSSDDDSTSRNKGRRGEDVEMRGTEGYNNAKYKQRLKTRNAVLEAVASAFVDPAKQRMAAAGAQPLSQEEAISVLVRITSTVTSAITQFDSLASWETKLLVCSIYAKLVAKLIALVANDPNEGAAVQLWITVKPIWDTVIFKHFTDARDASSHEKVRVEAARCGGVSLDLLAAATSLPGSSNAAAGEFARVKGQLENLRTIDASDVVKTELTTVLDKPRS